MAINKTRRDDVTFGVNDFLCAVTDAANRRDFALDDAYVRPKTW
jgi:hypothetical protein